MCATKEENREKKDHHHTIILNFFLKNQLIHTLLNNIGGSVNNFISDCLTMAENGMVKKN